MTYSSESEFSEAIESNLNKYSHKIQDAVKSLSSKDQKKFACYITGCSATFSRPWRLEAHHAAHLGKKPFPCDIEGCTRAYTSNYQLRRHKATAHVEPAQKKTFRCSFEGCSQTFTFLQNVKKHIRRTHSERICKTCGALFSDGVKLKKHLRTHKEKALTCEQCHVTFSDSKHFKRHKLKHEVRICPVKKCDVECPNWSLMRKHMRRHPYDYNCVYCKKGYRIKSYLRRHIIRYLETGFCKKKRYQLKKFTCCSCQAEVIGKASLQRHIRAIHESENKDCKPKVTPNRAPRKDKGIPKRSMASLLSAVSVPSEVEKALIENGDKLNQDPVICIAEAGCLTSHKLPAVVNEGLIFESSDSELERTLILKEIDYERVLDFKEC